MAQKVLQLIHSCGGCPHYKYDSGGRYYCELVDETVTNKSIVAPFCPLPDYPSKVIADMSTTIDMMREPYTFGLNMTILMHVATKLKTTCSDSGMVTILLKDEESIYLRHDSITKIDTVPWVIHFICGDRKFKLYPDGKTLMKEVKVPSHPEPLWEQLELA